MKTSDGWARDSSMHPGILEKSMLRRRRAC